MQDGSRPILVASDGSPAAQAAVAWAADLAGQVHRPVVVVMAAPLLTAPPAGGATDPDLELRNEAMRQLRFEVARPLAERSLAYTTELAFASPVTAIVESATAHDAYLIVVGCRGLGRLAEALLGSTSHGVATRAAAPVAVIHGPGEPEERSSPLSDAP